MSAACDTSVLVPALVAAHPDHVVARASMGPVTAIPDHVFVEAYSVLTRLPGQLRVAAADAARALDALRLPLVGLPSDRLRGLVARCASARISGGATYDALVGAIAAEHDLVLVTRDRRAIASYQAVGTRYLLV